MDVRKIGSNNCSRTSKIIRDKFKDYFVNGGAVDLAMGHCKQTVSEKCSNTDQKTLHIWTLFTQ